MTDSPTASPGFVDVTDDHLRRDGGERHTRVVDEHCWISVLHRLTGFGFMEWETAICFNGQEALLGGKQDTLIIRGDHRAILESMPKDRLREWYAANIEGNRNAFETIMHSLNAQQK